MVTIQLSGGLAWPVLSKFRPVSEYLTLFLNDKTRNKRLINKNLAEAEQQSATMSREGALWIGGLENYMDEDFILKAMQSMGETNILSIKVIKNKFTGGAAGYGFINFISDQVALTCMHKLNGKMIPGTQPPVRSVAHYLRKVD